jgi:DNA-binding NtrC family response regulator
LRERTEDIPLLVQAFVDQLSGAMGKRIEEVAPESIEDLISYPWPGNVRELRNLVESMVVLSPGREITAADIPRELRESGSARFLPVPVGAVVRGQHEAGGRELEFIVRSLVELKLQLEELRRRVDDGRPLRGELVGEVRAGPISGASALEPAPSAPVNSLQVQAGMTMAEIEKAAIVHALRETRGNRRKAADMLGIGERTMYRKLKEYNLPEGE